MLGRKKPAPQPLALSSDPTRSSSTRSQRQDANLLAADVDLETASSAAGISPRSLASTGTSPSLRSKFAQKRPQTAKPGSQSKSMDIDSLPQRRPSQPSAYSNLTSPPDQQAQQGASLRQAPAIGKKTKSGFFHFTKPSKTINQLPFQNHQHSASRSQIQSRGSEGPSTSRQGEPSPHQDISHENTSHNPLRPSPSNLSLSSVGEREVAASKSRPKSKGFGLLGRNRSQRDNDTPDPMPAISKDHEGRSESPPLKTSPLGQERNFREMMDSQSRNRSVDRVPARDASLSRENHRESRLPGRATPPPGREHGHGGSAFLSGLRSSSTKAAGMFGKSFFGKAHRSGSTNERLPMDDEHYELKVINLPLVAQTRKTRISKRLEDSRDKTEFWMPAFPWRAIDYLNYKGCEVEGLYRVPGSGPQIKKWQRRFDEFHDVNLFEATDLYDINIIGSMLKAWLRELPDELFPKAAQERIARECAGAETVPQMLIDELSNLSPFQYYLLFAITCHLSLLLAHSDKNKMDFRNLCICFQPCMKIDAFCFKFLVCDWRECWKGCMNEPAYIEQEYILLDQTPPRGLAEASQEPPQSEPPQAERQLGPPQLGPPFSPASNRSESSGPSYHSAEDQPRESNKHSELSKPKNSAGSEEKTISTSLSLKSNDEPQNERPDLNLRPLSPIAPLSPLGFS